MFELSLEARPVTAVPKVAIAEDGDAGAAEDNVGLPSNRPQVLSVAARSNSTRRNVPQGSRERRKTK